MHTSDLALVAYASWTLALVFAIAGLRASLTLTGKRAANSFSVTGDDVSPFSARLCRAHANCVENLPVFAAVVVAARLSGHAAAVDPISPFLGRSRSSMFWAGTQNQEVGPHRALPVGRRTASSDDKSG